MSRNFVDNFKGFPIYISDKYPKKYYAIVNKEKKYFGDVRYQQYYDKIGVYHNLDHLDKKRRNKFWSRHHKSINKIGTPGWFALHVLW